MKQTVEQRRAYMAGLLLLTTALACSGRSTNGENAGGSAGTSNFAGAGGSGAGNAGGASGGSTTSSGGSNDNPLGGSAGSVASGGSTIGGAGEGNDAGGEASGGSAGEGPADAVRFLLLEPPAPPSTPEGLMPDDERNLSTSYCCASADASVIVGSSTYVFPRFSDKPSGELTRAFIWREKTGLKDLGSISDPHQGFVASITPAYLTADGSRVLGSYLLGEAGPGGSEPVWSTHLGGFFVWSEAQGYTRIGPPNVADSGYITGYSADAKTVLGQVQSGSDAWADFLWTEADGFSWLKDLVGWPGEGRAISLSRDGSSILGIAGESGFRWRKAGFQWLGTVGIWPVCRPEVMSADGAVIAGVCQNGSQPPITFRWTEAAGMAAIDVNSPVQILPAAITDQGDVLVGSEVRAGGPLQHGLLQGFAFWQSGGNMQQTVSGADVESTYLLASHGLTPDGSAAIGARLSNIRRSGDFQWTKTGGMRDLPPLNATDQVYALGQSKDGRIVAGSSGPNAVLWDAAGARDIAADLRSASVDQKGWALSLARGVISARSLITHGSASKSVPNSTTPEERVWIAWLHAR
ncbi:MAG: hypothetical protein ABJB12_08350 [Pseudomonadota bacterium]